MAHRCLLPQPPYGWSRLPDEGTDVGFLLPFSLSTYLRIYC